ncbi:MAG: hypothetical protein AAGB12_00050 [Pseudomonadota bacterium]
MNISEETFSVLRTSQPTLALKVRNLNFEKRPLETCVQDGKITSEELEIILKIVAQAGRQEAEKALPNQERQHQLKSLLTEWLKVSI